MVRAASRLHFGMFAFGRPEVRQFGGVGAMIERPGIQLRVLRADELTVSGPLADRAKEFARLYFNTFDISDRGYEIEILSAPSDHVGLGVGTQLALSVVSGLRTLIGNPPLETSQLAKIMGRAARSAIGTYGFEQGGLLVDAGKLAGESVSPLLKRVPLPDAWRFVLSIPISERGLHGAKERQAFGEMPPIDTELTQRLKAIANEEIIPAASAAMFKEFSVALHEFNRLAGTCFASYQYGPFATPRVARLIDRLLQLGVEGVGQSSWGPTIFALTADDSAAQNLVESMRSMPETADTELLIAAPRNQGAHIEEE